MDLKNKKAYFNYQVIDQFDAGVILLGSEVKSIRNGDVNFVDSFVYFDDGELFLRNLHIGKYKNSTYLNHDELRDRKLLLNKSEIRKISKEMQSNGITIVPLEIFILRNKVKIKIGICKGKKLYNKKESIKNRDLQREIREF